MISKTLRVSPNAVESIRARSPTRRKSVVGRYFRASRHDDPDCPLGQVAFFSRLFHVALVAALSRGARKLPAYKLLHPFRPLLNWRLRNEQTFVLAATALLAGSIVGMAHATTTVRRVMQQQVVSYADLNLDTEADAATLLGRIKSAARKVCGMNRGQPRCRWRCSTNCRSASNEATARAVNDVNAPLLTRRQIVVRNDE